MPTKSLRPLAWSISPTVWSFRALRGPGVSQAVEPPPDHPPRPPSSFVEQVARTYLS